MKSAQLSVLSIRALVLLSAVWLTLPGLALAEKPDDAEALRGVCSLMCASRRKTRSVSGIGPKSRDSHQPLVGR